MNTKTLKRFIELAPKHLKGDWVVIGGAVLPLIGGPYRATLDIDLAGPQSSTQKETLRLMELAAELGLPPEAINQAGAFFLRKIPRWKEALIPLAKTKTCTLYRPNAYLYIQLKAPRLSESDFVDCLNMIALESPTSQQKKALVSQIRKLMESAPAEKQQRYQSLLEALSRS